APQPPTFQIGLEGSLPCHEIWPANVSPQMSFWPSLCGSDAVVTLPICTALTVELSIRRPVAPPCTTTVPVTVSPVRSHHEPAGTLTSPSISVASICTLLHSKPALPGVGGTITFVDIRWSSESASPT